MTEHVHKEMKGQFHAVLPRCECGYVYDVVGGVWRTFYDWDQQRERRRAKRRVLGDAETSDILNREDL